MNFQQLMSRKKQQHNVYTNATPPFDYVRGVNLGGWLTLERFIVPYQFAITDCHLRGEFCWYPGQLSAPPTDSDEYQLCDFYRCTPVRPVNVWGEEDYPVDEYTLASAFENRSIAAQWFNYHFDNFVSKKDMEYIASQGVTHIRVPLPHWILGDVQEDEPWVVGDRWKYFLRLLRWGRKVGIQVWPDIHTAPGSQNGFDNSGQQLNGVSCQGWSGNPTNVARSLQVIRDVTAEILREGFEDVVTGFGLLNEPFKDCHRDVYLNFINQGLAIVRSTLGQETSIYVSDMFLAKTFQKDRRWTWLGLDPASAVTYNNTYLDSHYYHVFADEPRALSPRQHIAYVCQNEYRDTISCCYEDRWQTLPSPAIKRMVGEWSVSYDTLPIAKLKALMYGISTSYLAPEFDRKIPHARREFLQRFAEAQMVAYEASSVGTSGAWFYWTLKMEGGAFAEWDFIRGLKEGWIPPVPPPHVTSQSIYGTCYDIIFKTKDDMGIVNEFPDPATLPANNWQGVDIDDDVVVTHGQSLLANYSSRGGESVNHPILHNTYSYWILIITVIAIFSFVSRALWRRRHKADYSRIQDDDDIDHVNGKSNGCSSSLSISV